jgi:hypothetical protein
MKNENYNPNEQETEEDALRLGALRLLKVRHQSKAFMAQTHSLLPLPKSMQDKTESPSKDNQNTQK